MRIGIILQTNEPEEAWNAVRFGNAALKEGHEVKIFLISAGVEVESIEHEKYDVNKQIGEFVQNHGTMLECGTCVKSRNQGDSAACSISTMIDCVKMVEWADKVVTF